MTSSPKLVLTPEARRDFRSILRYTRRKWGDHQRDEYADRLISAMHDLTLFPLLGVARDDIVPGLRAQTARHHVIFYRLDGDEIFVTRILHKNMDRSALREP